MKSFLPLLFILISMSGISQIRINSESHENIQRLISQSKEKTHLELKSDNPLLPIYKVNGELCLSTLAKVSPNFNVSDLNDKAFIGSRVADIITLKIPLKNLTEINNFANIIQLNVAEKIIPHNNRMTADVRADSVWEGVNLPQAYTGKNVLIGITDWGFDYSSPMYYDTLLQNSRILAAWDQFKTSGPAPANYPYGTEYSTPTELALAQADTANIYSYATHGSHVVFSGRQTGHILLLNRIFCSLHFW